MFQIFSVIIEAIKDPLLRRLIRPAAQKFRRPGPASSSSTNATAERRWSVSTGSPDHFARGEPLEISRSRPD
ncbi:MAG TPA: hypothetical protein VJX94_26855 [Stellaceae bacterium]|nr:hypothetical protein [Stellaceae bacterium]